MAASRPRQILKSLIESQGQKATFEAGDTVKITAGQYRGDYGKVVIAYPDISEAMVRVPKVGTHAQVRVAFDDLVPAPGYQLPPAYSF